MSLISKNITLFVPSKIIYNAIKYTKLENNSPAFFIGIRKGIASDNPNSQITFKTSTLNHQITIYETFKLKILAKNKTQIEYITETNTDANNAIAESIIQTHVANILYSFLMLQTGYVNGRLEKSNREKSSFSSNLLK
jgi:hypothetical protein